MEQLTLVATGNNSPNRRTVTGTQIVMVVRLGSRELLVQVDGDGNYTLNALIDNQPVVCEANGNLLALAGKERP